MANRNVHQIVGGTAGVLLSHYWSLDSESCNSWEYRTGAGLGGIIGGTIPDIIDPPWGPNHRSIGHSVIGNMIGTGTLIACADKIDQILMDLTENHEAGFYFFGIPFYRFLSGFIKGFIAGQISHLILDLMTPKRLPF